jgi:hypothetical protein
VKPPRHKLLLDKSIASCIAAIEVYNKPDFRYREETFSVLLVNAWELLLKARIVQKAGGMKALYVRERRILKNGKKSRRLYPKKNRAGNPMTIGFFRALEDVSKRKDSQLDGVCLKNLSALVEIRDNAVHLTNKNARLCTLVQAYGAAALSNYLTLAEAWFGENLAKYNFYLLPISLPQRDDPSEYTLVRLNDHAKNLVKYLASTAASRDGDPSSRFSAALSLEIRYTKTSDAGAQLVRVSNDPNATKVTLSDDQFHTMYPLDYGLLTAELRKRYPDFKVDRRYHSIRKGLVGQGQFCHVRLLDPTKPGSGRKYFFSYGALAELEKHYACGPTRTAALP